MRKKLFFYSLLALTAFMFGCVLYPGFDLSIRSPWIIGLFSLVFFAAAFSHSWSTLGRRKTVVFFAVMIFVAFTSEYAGTHQGIFYSQRNEKPLLMEGHTYYYADYLPMHFAKVPIVLLLMWPFAIYSSFLVASGIARRWRFENPWSVSVLSAFIAMLWDTAFDPLAVKAGYWTWVGGGSAFRSIGEGIPIGNFTSWFLITFLAVGLYFLLERKKAIPKNSATGSLLSLNLFAFIFAYGIGQGEFFFVALGAITQLLPWYLANNPLDSLRKSI